VLADVQTLLQILIWFLCLVLILLILVQGGSGDLSSTFGGGGQLDSSLGVGASRKMGKITGWLSFSFLLIVLVMAIPAGGSYADLGHGAPEGVDEDATMAPADAADEDPVVPVPEPVDDAQPEAADANDGAEDAAAEDPATEDEASPAEAEQDPEPQPAVEDDPDAALELEVEAPQPAPGD